MNKADEQWEVLDRILSEGVDLRAEVVLAELLLASAIRQDSFLQWPSGAFGRSVKRDIERLHAPGAMEWAAEMAVVELNRGGLYDLLPEGFFHQLRRTRPFIQYDDAVQEVRHNDAIEKAARSFLLPLDHELLCARLQVELNERQLTAELLKDRTGRGIIGFWDPPKEFTGNELGKLLMLLPRCHRITGDLDAMADAIMEVLGLPISLEHRYQRQSRKPEKTPPTLDNLHLGMDSVLHGETISCERVMHVTLGPLEAALADTFVPGLPGYVKLCKLMDYLAPADQVWELDIQVLRSSASFQLDTGAVSRRLGVSSVLDQ